MTRDDGGPAFPQAIGVSPSGDVYYSAEVFQGAGGISVRDYFAAAALQGGLAHPENTGDPEQQALWAYKCADAMLSERTKVKP